MRKPVIGIILGDATGVGPEIVCKMLDATRKRTDFRPIVIGNEAVLKAGMRHAGKELEYRILSKMEEISDLTGEDSLILYDNGRFDPGDLAAPTKELGNSIIEMIKAAVEMVDAGLIDAIVYAPINKSWINLANPDFSDEMQLFKHFTNCDGLCLEMNHCHDVWTARVTGHVPLMQVSKYLSVERILEVVTLTDKCLRDLGIANPRIYVAALNPHGGEGGLFGTEEIEIITPAVEAARKRGMNVLGPYPADTVFHRAFAGECHAVITMYHDQGQIALKTKGFGEGVTMLAGLPIIALTPAHGVGYDIAGKGIANHIPMLNTVNVAVSMVRQKERID
ncbi:MAG TPA: 4-hydroxythreonine-4-phosphate dehydrogenase PdxA [Clostridia bacterium]|nr:4-hydroxythreonine-4-phosphate dehydrogenase PdxA [Clostridia bacterium]